MQKITSFIQKFIFSVIFVVVLFGVYTVDADILDYWPAILSAATSAETPSQAFTGTWAAYTTDTGLTDDVTQIFTVNISYNPTNQFYTANINYDGLQSINLAAVLSKSTNLLLNFSYQHGGSPDYVYYFYMYQIYENAFKFSFSKTEIPNTTVYGYSGSLVKQ